MKKSVLILLLVTGSLTAQPLASGSAGPAFGVGEKLYYRMRFSGFNFINIKGGHAMVSVKKKTMLRGRQVYVFQSRLTSKNTIIDRFFKIRDTITSYWDIKRQQPLRTVMDIKEGRYLRVFKADFDLNRNRANYTLKVFKGNTNTLGVANKNAKWEHSKGTIKKLPQGFQDVIGAFYKMRLDKRRGRKGQKFYLNVVASKKQARLQMTILGFEKVKVAAGTFKAIKVKPYIKSIRFFRSYGKVFVWVSDDRHRYPVKIEAHVPYAGKITAELVKVVKPEPAG